MNKERIGSLFFLSVGFVAFFLSLRFEIGSLNRPGPAMFPLILSVSLCIVGMMILISGRRGERIDWHMSVEHFTKPVKILILTVGFILAFGKLGYLATSSLYLFGLFLWVCRFRLWKTVLWAVVLASAGFYFFGRLLSVQLPMGPFTL